MESWSLNIEKVKLKFPNLNGGNSLFLAIAVHHSFILSQLFVFLIFGGHMSFCGASRVCHDKEFWWFRGCEFKPHWGQYLTKFILLCVTLDLSDNLTEMRIVENSSDTPVLDLLLTSVLGFLACSHSCQPLKNHKHGCHRLSVVELDSFCNLFIFNTQVFFKFLKGLEEHTIFGFGAKFQGEVLSIGFT